MLRHTPTPFLCVTRGIRLWTCLCKDYYQVLGLPRTCTAKDIRSKYVELCKLYHPDTVTSGDVAEQDSKKKKFQEVQEAYNTLSKETDRRSYDDFGVGSTDRDPAYEWARRQHRPHEAARDPYARAYEYHKRRRQNENNDTGGWSWGEYWKEDFYEKEKTDEYYRKRRQHFEQQKEEWARFARQRARHQDSTLENASIVITCLCFIISGIFIRLMLQMTHTSYEQEFDDERARILAMSERRRRMMANPYNMSNVDDRQSLERAQADFAHRFR